MTTLADRWCIFNSFGWPPDMPMPETNVERCQVARAEMDRAVREIGMAACLARWNDPTRNRVITPAYQYVSSLRRA